MKCAQPLLLFLWVASVLVAGQIPASAECNANTDERLFGFLLFTFLGEPDKVSQDEISALEEAVEGTYNHLVSGCTSGFRTITETEIRTNFGDFASLGEDREFTVEVRLEGTCRECVNSPTLLFQNNITCACQGPTEQDLFIQFQQNLETYISDRLLLNIESLVGVVELVEIPCVEELTEFTSSIVMEYIGDETELTADLLQQIGSIFGDTYNSINGLNAMTCDPAFRRITSVSVSVGSNLSRRLRSSHPVERTSDKERRLSTDDSELSLLLDIVLRCRGCVADDSFIFNEESDDIETDRFRRLMETKHLERGLQLQDNIKDECRCPTGATFRAVSEDQMLTELQTAYAELPAAAIEQVVDLFEIEPANCTSVVNEFSSIVELDFNSTTPTVEQVTIQELGNNFIVSYNQLAQRFCDPFFREVVSSVATTETPARGRLLVDATSNSSFAQATYSLKFTYSVVARCRGCPSDTSLFDDGIRRRQLSRVSNSQLSPFEMYSREAILASGKSHRYLQGDSCFCSAVTVIAGAPTEREFFNRYSQDVVDNQVNDISAVSGVQATTGMPPPPLFDCETDAECLQTKQGDSCIAQTCINEGNPRFTLTWTGDDDYDLYVTTPEGVTLFYDNQFDASSGGIFDTGYVQDVTSDHIESIYFPRRGSAPGGDYVVRVDAWKQRGAADTWKLEIFGSKGELEMVTEGLGSQDDIVYDNTDAAEPPEDDCDIGEQVECCKNMDCPDMQQDCINRQCIEKANPRFALYWYGDDNLDLIVRTPDGVLINEENPVDPLSGCVFESDLNEAIIDGPSWHTESVACPRDGSSPNGFYTYYVEVKQQVVLADTWTLEVFFIEPDNTLTRTGSRASEYFVLAKFPGISDLDGSDGSSCVPDGQLVECCSDDQCQGPEKCTLSRCVDEGTPRFTLAWLGDDDLDIYAITPGGVRIFWNNTSDEASEGELEGDPNPTSDIAHVESISFEMNGKSPSGTYKYGVELWNKRGPTLDDWNLTVHVFGEQVELRQGKGASGVFEYVYVDESSPTESPVEPPMILVEVPEGFCFSAESIVSVEGKGMVPMKLLQIGDRVMARDGKFEQVYSFGHRDETLWATFLQFFPSKLEVSPNHMVFVQNKGFVPASSVKNGDKLSDGSEVRAVRSVTRQGVYSPYTPSGTLAVNNVLASNYIAFQDSDVLKIGSFRTPLTYQWLDHSFQTPHRIWCFWLGMKDTSLANGFSPWSWGPYKVAQWFLKQHPALILILLVPFLTVLTIFACLEPMLISSISIGGLVMFAAFQFRNSLAEKKQRCGSIWGHYASDQEEHQVPCS